MMQWMITLWTVNAIAGIVLSAILIIFRRKFSLARWISDVKVKEAPTKPLVTVVIAARNEEQSVEHTLRQFTALPTVAQVILVDDGSEDNTLQIARSVATDNPHVRVFEAPPLPSGWIGKTHAIHWGSKYVSTEFILFTDADIHLYGLPLKEIISRMSMDALDHVGGNFRIEEQRVSEAMTAPVLAATAFVALGLSTLRSGAATGAFNLVRTSAYRQMDGHLQIRDHVVDDVALARYMKSKGFRSRFVDVSPVLSVRLYHGFKGFASAVSRSAIPFLGHCPCLALALSLIGVFLSFALLLQPIVLLASLAYRIPSCTTMWGIYGLIPATYLCSTLPYILAGWLHFSSRWWSLSSPIGLAIMTTTVTISAIRCMFGLSVRWRGRSYPHSRRQSRKHGRET